MNKEQNEQISVKCEDICATCALIEICDGRLKK